MSAFNAPIPQSPADTRSDRLNEPSMEDILASIRRIIADDQSRSAGGGGQSTLRHAPQSDLAETQGAGNDDASVVAPSTPLEREAILDLDATHPHLNVPSLQPSYDDGAHGSMMDEIASIGAASMARSRTAPPVSLPDRLDLSSAPISSDLRNEEPGPVGANEDGSSGTMQIANAALANRQDDGTPAEPLVSMGAGASVGSSLQALASSVLLQNNDMVEQMTRDMLRPMLKDWLDDNLPTIVERLVRIEIERVARGR